MDEKRHPNPRTFDPVRFVNDSRSEFDAATDPDVSKRGNFAFGAGRRFCQGIHIAERSLFLAMSGILWAFNLSKPLGADGKPVTPDIDDIVGGITVQPAPFDVDIKPRSPSKEKTIRAGWVECEEGLLDKETRQWKEVPDVTAFSK